MISFLAGVRVLDMGQFLPGPYCAQILSDMGADVVKLEPPGGDPMREFGPLGIDGLSLFYKGINAGKKVISLDLKSPDGKTAFTALIKRTDVLIESFRPGALERLGFAHDHIKILNPRLIHCALSGFGQSGPYRKRAGHDINYMAMAGGLAASGTTDKPVFAAPPVADFASGSQAASAVLAALFGRERGSTGCYLDMSIAESVLAWQGMNLTACNTENHRPERARNLLNGGAACYQIYRTRDGRFVSLGAIEPKFWANFCQTLARPDWIARQAENLPQTALIDEVAAAIAQQDLSHWQERLDPVDCCFHTVVEIAEIAEHPQIRARGMLASDPEAPGVVQALYPAWLDGSPPEQRRPVKTASCEEVLAAWHSDEA
ncbi:CaiB/BaiF CoA transferase family protein [Denitrobaculum tricleocarpae]|uniref:CoA transferase n=1 Tax=Denitrobaculum tricleocarpae TaxID=2591009 RepID=A0A545TT78_9PROT|nr:CoA transferase [Denitrobaculum tricleocarpae]TQV80423.1 CoA transferase [Denitrobaculum tricleocarpae]